MIKNTLKQKWGLLILISILAISVSAQEIWVSPDGNDSNPGTETQPVKSLLAAQLKARELRKQNNPIIINGIKIILKDGIYTLNEPLLFKTEDSGTKESPTIIVAENYGKALISGGVKISGWKKVRGNIYKANLNRDTKLRTLFVDGDRKRMAGTDDPVKGLGNWGSFEIKGTEEWAFGAGVAMDGIKFRSKDIKQYKNPEDIELVQFNVWNEKILCARDIVKIGDTTVIKLQQPYGAIATNMAWSGAINYKNDILIRNAYELLDSPGEFYFDRKSKTIYYYSEGENMSTAEVIAPNAEGLIQMKGESVEKRVRNIRFEGITFSYDHWNLMEIAGSHAFAGIQSLALAIKYIPDGNWHPTEYNSTNVPRGAIDLQNAENIDIIHNRFEGISSAIVVNLVNDVKNCNVDGNYFNDMLGNAVSVGHPQHYKIGDGDLYENGVEGLCEYITVANNYIRNMSLDFRQVEAITSFVVANVNIDHNDIKNTPYGAITCGWWWGNAGIPPSNLIKNNSISYNRAGDTHQILDDGGIIYVLGKQPDSRIIGNYVFNGPRCLYPDNGAAYFTIKDNVVDNPSYKWMWLHLWNKNCHDNVVYRNYVKNNLYMNNGTNNIVEYTYSFRDEEFTGEAVKLIENAGIEDKFKDIVPDAEPQKISIHPKDFKQGDVFH